MVKCNSTKTLPLNDRGNNSSNWQSEKAEKERGSGATVRTPSDITVNHVTPISTLVNSAVNVATWNPSLSPHDKYQSD